MKYLKLTFLLALAFFLSACSFGYDILIINDSDKPIEVHYKINEKGQFNNPYAKSIEDWNIQKSIRKLWTKEKSWEDLAESEYTTNLETRERTIKIAPYQVIQIESGNYNPVSEEYGDLTDIIELKIKSANGEISYQGKILLSQFEKDGYTFIKRYKDELKVSDIK